MSDDEDVPTLSAETLLALEEFYKHREEKEKEMQLILQSDDKLEALSFEEDWQLSQFWYDDITIAALSDEAIQAVGPKGKIALISCPTLYKSVKEKGPECEVALFEFDKRFAVYKDFHLYDYKSPLDVPRNFSGYFDIVIADPPFLSEECLTKTALTVRFLTQNKIILCTGAVMEDLAKRLLGVTKSNFLPHHRNNLGNEFFCYSNYKLSI